MHLLLDSENYPAMHFLPNGDAAFVICNVKEFLKLLMKKYRLTKFGYFIGKL